MCGRFTLDTTGREIARQFEVVNELELGPRYNIAPTQESPVVGLREAGADRKASLLRWGLVPFWADDPKIGNKMINARAETVADKPAFRAAFKRRRCVVPASGFYEWKPTDDGKQPYYIKRADDSLLGFAGLWEHWSDDETGESIDSFTILTGEPNDLLGEIHDRMPVILQPNDYGFWLDPENDDKEALQELVLQPYPSEQLEAYPVSTHVNSPQNDDPGCIEPLD